MWKWTVKEPDEQVNSFFEFILRTTPHFRISRRVDGARKHRELEREGVFQRTWSFSEDLIVV
jgi:hypothetical protein